MLVGDERESGGKKARELARKDASWRVEREREDERAREDASQRTERGRERGS